MFVFKGDTARTESGLVGEVIETWGVARTFLRLRKLDGKTIPIFEREVVEIIKRAKHSTKEVKRRK